jgi:hypothetical protein
MRETDMCLKRSDVCLKRSDMCQVQLPVGKDKETQKTVGTSE